MKKEHIKYKDFLEKSTKIVLSNQQKVEGQYKKTVKAASDIIDKITELPDERKICIINSIYENNGKTDGLTEKITQELEIPEKTAEEICDSIKKGKLDFKHNGKVPMGKWEQKPINYYGFDDEKYGTAFQCHYISELGLFFVVIDIDAHNSDTDIPIDSIESSIPEEYKDTRVINTGSGGKHYYYLSKEPPKANFDSNINIDYKTIFANNVEKKIDGTYKEKGKGGYVVASYRWSYDGTKKEEYIHDDSSNEDILIVENTDIIIQQIKDNLISKGLIEEESKAAIENDKADDFVPKPLTLPLKEEIKENAYTEETGIQLITQEVAKIIRKTEGEHNTVLLALEGGLQHIGFREDHRLKILMDALEKANDLTVEHKTQINHSLNNNGRKRGFRFLRINYNEIRGEIERIYLLKQIYWKSISGKDYKIIKIHYMELISALFKIVYEEKHKKSILLDIDAYFNMRGFGLNERLKLIEEINEKYGIKDLNTSIMYRTENQYTYALIIKGKLNLNKEIQKKYREALEEYEDELNKLTNDLDMQLSITEIRNKTPNIQPLINLINRPGGLEAYKRRQYASKYLRRNENLKKTEDGIYIFDDQIKNSYVPVDSNKLGDFLTRKYPILKIGIESTELENMLSLSGEFDELHNEYYIFNNGVLDVHERSFIETNDFMDYFTIRKMDCKLKLEKTIPKITDSPSCLVDKVLREILVPDYKEGKKNQDYRYYLDFLQRIGSCFNTRIKDKKFACYYGKGDNGKDILIEILKMAFGSRCLLATMDILQDEKADLSQYDVVIIDELDKNSFDSSIAFIKRITGGEEEGTAKRRHYQHDVFKTKNPSGFFLFTNEIPAVSLTEDAFYRREDALQLQNRFLDNPNPDEENEFQADSSLKDKIKNSKEECLEWLINRSINAYYNLHNEEGYFKGFTMGQNAEQTKMIVSNTDPLSKFLRENYVIDDNRIETISNKDLVRSYENYCIREKLTCNTTKLSINMGNTIKNIFGDVKKKATNNTLYFLKGKPQNDNDITYYIDSNYEWYQKKDEIPEDTYDNYEQVYLRIDEITNQGLVPTKLQLKKEFWYYNIEEILDKLESIDLIFKGKR